MPRKGSPYGERQHVTAVARIKRSGRRCVHCNWRLATEGDHLPPLSTHRHRARSGCCRIVPSCGPCARLQGGLLRWRSERLEREEPGDIVEPLGFDVLDPVWDVPWLVDLREVPVDAVWPRLMSAPHPDAVGSIGAEIEAWATAELGVELRWFQRLVLRRICEHDADGRLVWVELLLTMARQLGKSTVLRVLLMWRLHQADRFGEVQTIVHLANKMSIVLEVMRPAIEWVRSDAEREELYVVRSSHAEDMIEFIADGSRWLGRARSSSGVAVGIGAAVAAVDEAWCYSEALVSEDIEPTIVERVDPWLLLMSTAKSDAKSLIPTRRAEALGALGAPGDGGLLIEWSAPRIMDIEDPAGWRMASPHWSPLRERMVRRAVARALSGEVDPQSDELDPVEAVRTQWLNQWPIRQVSSGVGEPLVASAVWQACARPTEVEHQRLWVAVEDNYGQGAAVAAVALCVDDRLEVDGWLCESRDVALRDAVALMDESSLPGRLIVGASIPTDLDVDRSGSRETRVGLPLVRSLLAAGRIVHDDTPDIDEQIGVVRVREVSGGLGLVSGQRSDLVRAMAWALMAAVVREPLPAIHAVGR